MGTHFRGCREVEIRVNVRTVHLDKKGGRYGEVAVSGGLTLALSVLPKSEMKNSTQTALLFQSCLWIRLVCGYVKHTSMPIIEIHTTSNQWDDQSIHRVATTLITCFVF